MSSGWAVKSQILSNQELSEELQKAITRKFEKQKLHSFFIDNIWGADLANMQLISKFNKGTRFYYKLLIFSVNMYEFFP